jgi:hypothetical protein
MVWVRTLARDEKHPREDDWVLVEKRGSSYFITARQEGKPIEKTSAFESPEIAIRAATSLADSLASPYLYVRSSN